ncbi:MAG: hemerythrin domain-containing protein [Bacteroidota bacterium]
MQTLRFNLFHQIHQALRALLYHASITVQHTDFTQAEQSQKTITMLEQLVAFFEGHAHTEDTLVFPMLAAIAPEVIANFEAQHEEDHRLGDELVNSIALCKDAATAVEQIMAGTKLQRALNAFTAFNLTHMNQEETIVLDLIHAHYTDAQLFEKEMEIVASLSPEKKAFSAYWMLKGLAVHEIIDWYEKIRTNAPSFVFDEHMQLAENALSAEKLREVQQALQLLPA